MRRFVALLTVILLVVSTACTRHLHEVGNGAHGGAVVEQRQWYILFGLVPLNHVDSKQMAAGATDYSVRTEASALDVIMTIFTAWVTVNSRTVTVSK